MTRHRQRLMVAAKLSYTICTTNAISDQLSSFTAINCVWIPLRKTETEEKFVEFFHQCIFEEIITRS